MSCTHCSKRRPFTLHGFENVYLCKENWKRMNRSYFSYYGQTFVLACSFWRCCWLSIIQCWWRLVKLFVARGTWQSLFIYFLWLLKIGCGQLAVYAGAEGEVWVNLQELRRQGCLLLQDSPLFSWSLVDLVCVGNCFKLVLRKLDRTWRKFSGMKVHLELLRVSNK